MKIDPTGQAKPRSCSASRPAGFLLSLFRYLDETDTRYCVLHSWRHLPQELLSDLDIAVHPADRVRLADAFRRLRDDGFRPIQLFNYNVNANYFVFSWNFQGKLQTVAVDVIFEHRRAGIVAARGDEITATRERCREFWVASPVREFEYLLLKKTAKGKVKSEQSDRLRELVGILGRGQASEIAQGLFPLKESDSLVKACMNGTLPTDLLSVRKSSWSKSVLRHPMKMLRYFGGNAERILRRLRKPTGILMAILGPDGVGKSSVILPLRNQLGPAFKRERYFHWRPQFFARRKSRAPVSDPHAKPARGPLLSSLYLTIFLLDYFLGFLFVLYPLKARGGFLLFDRYFYDVLADPKRVRYGGPPWLARWYSRLVPTPDLVVVLDAETHTVLARKKEIPADEIDRQREVYRRLPVDPSRLLLIRTDGSPDETIHHVALIVAEHLSRRFECLYPEWAPILP